MEGKEVDRGAENMVVWEGTGGWRPLVRVCRRLLQLTYHLWDRARARETDSCLDPQEGVKRVEGGRGGDIFYERATLVAPRELLKREGWEISRISISITSGLISPTIYKSPRPSQIK